MRLTPASREYATWTVNGADDDTALSVTFGGDWHPLERVDAGTVRVLVAGPAATSNPPGTVVLVAGRNNATIRAADNPEVVIRSGGVIDVSP